MKQKLSLEKKIGLRTNAKGLYQYAEIYWRAYSELTRLSEGTAKYYPADYFLAVRSIELSLKCVLRANGASLDCLANKYRHDLSKLVQAIKDKDYTKISEKEVQIINMVNHLYKTKQFEYKVVSLKRIPKNEDLDFKK